MHVDDELCLLEVSKQILTMENNFEIDNATSVDEAFEKMERQTYDAVVSDYEMPQKNGLDFLKELRDQDNQIPYILFTGKGREDVAVKALNLGADNYINKNGSPETVYCELADAIKKTVERKKSKELLAKSESKYHALVENSLQGMAILIADPLRIVFANGAFGKILGYSSQEVTSLSPEEIMSLVYHVDRAVFFKRMENRLRDEAAETCFEFRAVRKDSSIIWLSSLANRVDYDGQPAVQGMFLDVNESKIAVEVLRESEARYRELANCLPNIVFETDLNGQLEFANERATEISGYSQGELEKGLNILQFLAPKDREKAKKNIQRLLAGGSYVLAEYSFIRKNGTTFPALITATPRISGNKMTGLRGLAIDITERKKAEESLKESEEKFRTISEQSPNMIFINKRGRVVYTNKKCENTMGYTKKEFYSPNFGFLSLYAPEYIEEVKSFYAKQMRGEDVPSYECVLVTRGGERINAITTTKLIEYEGEKAVLGTVTDITERKKGEKALIESEENYRNLINSMNETVWVTDFNGNFVEVNAAAAKTLGYSKEELLTMGLIDIEKAYSEEQFKNRLKAMAAVGTTVFERVHITKDGSEIPVEISSSFITYRGEQAILSIARNITERKKNEDKIRQRIRKNELINEKLQVVGGLTRHDVGNKLMVVKSNIHMLKNKIGDNPELAKYFGGIDSAISQSDEMFEFSRLYEKIGVEKPSKIDVAHCFNQAVALLPNLGPIKIVNDCQGLEVVADSLLKKLFHNLLDNSLKYGGKVTQIRLHFTKEDEVIKLFYEDNGVGIPEANKQKLFTEGFTTGKSKGLGLFLIKKMVEVYGWKISEEGEPSKGARFAISIPKVNEKKN